MPNARTGSRMEYLTGGKYGVGYKEDMRRYFGSFVGFSGRGEMIPNDDSFCELDPTVKDKWGIPVLRFHWKWSEHETRQAKHMQETSVAIIEAMGGTLEAEDTPEARGFLTALGFRIRGTRELLLRR